MWTALDQLSDEERTVFLYYADIGTALCSAALIVLQFIGNLF
jgi:hypothetical protein